MPVRPQHDEVLDVGAVEAHRAVHQVGEAGLARRHQEADGVRLAGGQALRDLILGEGERGIAVVGALVGAIVLGLAVTTPGRPPEVVVRVAGG